MIALSGQLGTTPLGSLVLAYNDIVIEPITETSLDWDLMRCGMGYSLGYNKLAYDLKSISFYTTLK